MIYHIEHLRNRAILELKFNVLEPISVGMYNEGNIRKIIGYMNNDKFVPFIPSESIKGVLRSTASKIFKSMSNGFNCNKDNNYKHNISNNDLKGVFDDEQLKELDDDLKGVFDDEQLKELDYNKKTQIYIALKKCYVCKLFGSDMVAGKLTFTDLTINDVSIDVFDYTSTAIDRKKRIVKENSLFTTEYIIPERLNLTIIADNIEKSNEGKLFAALLEYMIKLGIKVGGLKSRGYGLIKLDESSLAIIIEFKEVRDKEDMIYNINALTLKDNYYKSVTIKEYIDELRL